MTRKEAYRRYNPEVIRYIERNRDSPISCSSFLDRCEEIYGGDMGLKRTKGYANLYYKAQERYNAFPT